MKKAGNMGAKVWGVLKRSPQALAKLLSNPVILIKNFFTGVKLGFNKFSANFIKHFKGAAMSWIFGTMSKAGLLSGTPADPP